MERGASSRASGLSGVVILLGFVLAVGVLSDGVCYADPNDEGIQKPRPTLADLKRDRGSSSTEVEPLPARGGSRFGEYLRVLAILVAVLAAAVGTIWVLKRFVPGARARGNNAAIQVISRAHLTSKHQIVMVNVAGRTLVLGISPEGISRVADVSDADGKEPEGFSAHIRREDSAYQNAQPDPADAPKNGSLGREVDRLKSMLASWRLSSSRMEGSR